MTIAFIVFSGSAASLYYLVRLNRTIQNETRIQHDLIAIMERIDSLSLASLNASFPQGTLDNSIGTETRQTIGPYRVPGERVSLTYAGTDPRRITATAFWDDHGRTRNLSVNTYKRG